MEGSYAYILFNLDHKRKATYTKNRLNVVYSWLLINNSKNILSLITLGCIQSWVTCTYWGFNTVIVHIGILSSDITSYLSAIQFSYVRAVHVGWCLSKTVSQLCVILTLDLGPHCLRKMGLCPRSELQITETLNEEQCDKTAIWYTEINK